MTIYFEPLSLLHGPRVWETESVTIPYQKFKHVQSQPDFMEIHVKFLNSWSTWKRETTHNYRILSRLQHQFMSRNLIWRIPE
jgi:hypothetical protein